MDFPRRAPTVPVRLGFPRRNSLLRLNSRFPLRAILLRRRPDTRAVVRRRLDGPPAELILLLRMTCESVVGCENVPLYSDVKVTCMGTTEFLEI